MRKLIAKKRAGQGDLIASFFVILALTLFVFYFINAIGDVNTRIELDQIARKYILIMEASGGLTTEQEQMIKNECAGVKAVKDRIGSNVDEITVTWNDGTQTPRGYGSNITLEITCPAYATSYIEGDNIVGSIKRNRPVNYTIRKQSTAKY